MPIDNRPLTGVTAFYGPRTTNDPTPLIDGAIDTTTVTVTNAALGDWCSASFSLDLQGIELTAVH